MKNKNTITIFTYDLAFLFYHRDVKENEYLVCDYSTCLHARKVKKFSRNSLLFQQLKEEYGQIDDYNNYLAIFDFSNFFNSYKTTKLEELLGGFSGIKLFVKENYTVTYVDFIKSQSMSRESKAFYINEKYKTEMYKRISLGLDDNNGVKLSKWFAYTGLVSSDADLCISKDKSIYFKDIKNHIAIVDDCELTYYDKNREFITAVSNFSIYNEKKNLETILKKEKLQQFANDCNHLKKDLLTDDYKDWENCINFFKSIYFSTDYSDYILHRSSSKFVQFGLEIIKTVNENLNKTPYELYEALKEFNAKKIIYKDREVSMTDYWGEVENEKSAIEWFKFRVKKLPIKVNLFDGEGIITNEFADEINESIKCYRKENNMVGYDSYSFQIRLPFIKGMVHATNIRQFLLDKGISDDYKIKSLTFGEEEYQEIPIRDIKIILTKSQFKCGNLLMNKFKKTYDPSKKEYILDGKSYKYPIEYYYEQVIKYNYCLGICREDKEKEIENGRLNYQFLSTLPIENDCIDILFNRLEKNIINKMSDKYFFNGLIDAESKIYIDDVIEKKNINEIGRDFLTDEYYAKDYILSKVSPNYYFNTKKYKDLYNKKYKSYVNDAFIGKIDAHCTIMISSGDLLNLLYNIFELDNEFDNSKKLGDKFYSPVFKNKRNEVVFLRNPHYSKNEIVFSVKTKDQERDKYFDKLLNVIMFDSMSLFPLKLSGSDFDGDLVLAVTENSIVNSVKEKLYKYEKKYIGKKKIMIYSEKYPTVIIPSIKENSLSSKDYLERMKCFSRTFSNNVGLISNKAFAEVLKNKSNDLKSEDKIAFFTVLGGLEIDSAKNGRKPLLRNEKKYIKPLFLKIKDSISNTTNIKKYTNDINKAKEEHILYYNAFKITNMEMPNNVNDYVKVRFEGNNSIECNEIISLLSVLVFKELIDNIDKGIKYSGNDKENTMANSRKLLINSFGEDVANQLLDNDFIYNAADKIKEYNNAKEKFHYMKQYDDREKYLKENYNFSDEDIEILSNFEKNQGYRNLYLLLLYFYSKKYDYELSKVFEEKFKSTDLTKTIDKYNKKSNNYFDKVFRNSTEKYHKIIDGLNAKYKELLDILKNQNQDDAIRFAIDNLYNSIDEDVTINGAILLKLDLYESSIIDLFFFKIVDYLLLGMEKKSI